jgi:hypothetical protein
MFKMFAILFYAAFILTKVMRYASIKYDASFRRISLFNVPLRVFSLFFRKKNDVKCLFFKKKNSLNTANILFFLSVTIYCFILKLCKLDHNFRTLSFFLLNLSFLLKMSKRAAETQPESSGKRHNRSDGNDKCIYFIFIFFSKKNILFVKFLFYC